ncbi:uncharacterized protein LOC114313363 [Camellia sinensis]|uniref:uncharacterized protein LOC114313363 n=1 Tax=Camellia sinensis TaxID=4442 RepID=UPI001036CC52|nr:uncharacterized protein LOC114313363 [Camellia sinensis]
MDPRDPLNLAKTSKEEDHLNQSIKKIKSFDSPVEATMENGVNMEIEDLKRGTPAQGSTAIGSPTPPPKSFKNALNLNRRGDYLFDSRVEILSSNEEDNELEGQSEIHHSYLEHLGLPKVTLPKKLLDKIRQPWRNALIVRLLGKNIGYKMLCTRVKNIWGLQGDFNAIDLGYNYFLFKFSEQADCTHVFTGGPWVIMDHYLMVRRWEPNFKPLEAFETITAVWVRFSELPIEYYQEKVLFAIAKSLGKPLKIDWTMTMAMRGKFARIILKWISIPF